MSVFLSVPSLTRAAIFSALALLSPWTQAMTYMPMSDEDLLELTPLVVVGRIVEAGAVPGRERDQTEYTLAVDEVIKGSTGRELRIRLPGALNPAQVGALVVPGMPRFDTDETVMLFLQPRSDGSYSVAQFALGRFSYARSSEGEPLWQRDMRGLDVVGGAFDPFNQKQRNADRFSTWLRERVAGHGGDNNYWSAATDIFRHKYALTNPRARWFEFDRGLSVPVYAGSVPQSGLSSGGYSELQTAINAWNNDSGSNIRLSYAGISSAAGGLTLLDGVTQVVFNDPGDEIAGLFDCLRGGIGAIGQWRGAGLQLYKGQMYYTISEGDIVVQDGIGCLLDNRRSNNPEELLAHELGHVLGLDHSCGDGLLSACDSGTSADEALMRPTMHADGRGATLSSDDRAAVAYLYDPNAAAGSGSTSDSAAVAQAIAGGGGGAMPLTGLAFLGLIAMLTSRRRGALQSAG